MKVQVVSLAGEVGWFEVGHDTNIACLQKKVATKLNLPEWRMQFATVGGATLTRDTTMQAAGMQGGGAVTLVLIPDIWLLTCGSNDGVFRISCASTGRMVREFRNADEHDQLLSAKFAPDCRSILAVSLSGDEIWNAYTGARMLSVRADCATIGADCTAIAPDMQHMAFECAPNVEIRTFPAGELKWNLPCGTLSMESSDVEDLVFSADSSLLAVPTKGLAQIWSIRTGELIHTFGDGWNEIDAEPVEPVLAVTSQQMHQVTCVVFLPSSAAILTGSSQGAIKKWCTASGRCTSTLSGHADCVWSLAITDNGSLLASFAPDSTRIWSIETCACLSIWDRREDPYTFGRGQFSSNGSWLLCSGGSKNHDLGICFEIRSTEAGTCSLTLQGTRKDDLVLLGVPSEDQGFTGAQFTTFVPWLISSCADGDVQLWCPATGDCLLTVPVHAGAIGSFGLDCALALPGQNEAPSDAAPKARLAEHAQSRSRSPAAARAEQD